MIVERFLTWAETAPIHLRAKAGAALTRAFLADRFDGAERDEAEAALTVLVDDPATEVRSSVAEALAGSPAAPRHIVTTLAADQPEIAMPILARSPVFIDAELVDLAATGSAAQQIAIACRRPVSAAVSAALAEIGELEAVVALLMNDAANIPGKFLHRIAERHLESNEVQKRLAARSDLLPQTWLLLLEMASERLRDQYSHKSWLPRQRIDAMVREQFDKAVIAFAAGIPQADLQVLIGELARKERLSTALLLRAVCMGNISMFASALAALAGVPAQRVEAILESLPGQALRSLYRNAGLPAGAYAVFSDLLNAWRDCLSAASDTDHEKLPSRITRLVLENYRDSADSAAIDSLLVLLRGIAAENERDSARSEINRIVERARAREQPRLAAPQAEADKNGEGIVFDIPDEIVAEFAIYLAEELVDLDLSEPADGSSAGGEQVAPMSRHSDSELDISETEPDSPGMPANDDLLDTAVERSRHSRAA